MTTKRKRRKPDTEAGEVWFVQGGEIWADRIDSDRSDYVRLVGAAYLAEDRERIIACVNALTGVETKAIEAGAVRKIVNLMIQIRGGTGASFGEIDEALEPFVAVSHELAKERRAKSCQEIKERRDWMELLESARTAVGDYLGNSETSFKAHKRLFKALEPFAGMKGGEKRPTPLPHSISCSLGSPA